MADTTGEEQKQQEYGYSDMPNIVVALATGSANGGSCMVSIVMIGNTWTFRCCGHNQLSSHLQTSI